MTPAGLAHGPLMTAFQYHEGRLHCEDVALADIAAEYGTPCYAYSRGSIEANWLAYDRAFSPCEHLICYAVKANSNLGVINLLARLGSGFDIVSVGELERVLKAGGDPKKVVFAGVGKREEELRRALEIGIRCFNVESESELDTLSQVAGSLSVRAPVAIRVNPDVDPETHPYISTGLQENKFGVAMETARSIYQKAAHMDGVEIVGVATHIGSQLVTMTPLLEAITHMLVLVDELAREDIVIQHLDIGGGLGIIYRDERPPDPATYAESILPLVSGRDIAVVVEPGRSISGPAGVLLTRVDHLKHAKAKSFAVVDAGMTDLLRPALYQAWQDILPVRQHPDMESRIYDVVGPVCETSDFLGKDRQLAIRCGDLLAVCAAGAYGFSMSSNYNSRPRPAEVMVDGATVHLVREREALDDLWRGEHVCRPSTPSR